MAIVLNLMPETQVGGRVVVMMHYGNRKEMYPHAQVRGETDLDMLIWLIQMQQPCILQVLIYY